MAAIECKLAMCISRLVKFELLLELKIEQNVGTLLHTACYKAASSLKQSVRGQYRLSIPVIYFDICALFHSDLACCVYRLTGPVPCTSATLSAPAVVPWRIFETLTLKSVFVFYSFFVLKTLQAPLTLSASLYPLDQSYLSLYYH
jgi:hypothetical protein